MPGRLDFEEPVQIPMDLEDLAAFRRWSSSEEFPEKGRIDFVAGRIEIEMTPEDLFTHGTVKTEIVAVLAPRTKTTVPGDLFSDRTRISSVPGDLSAEPDIVFVSEESIRAGRVRLIPSKTAAPGRFVEIEGGPDLVVEIVSDGSVNKDTKRLPPAYFHAGVREYWLVDARGADVRFTIHHRGADRFEPATVEDDGCQRSDVFGASFRLERTPRDIGGWRYDLRVRA